MRSARRPGRKERHCECLSGRLKAVLVASSRRSSSSASSALRAPSPAIRPAWPASWRPSAHVESHGDYTARNASSGAYGKYQIMPSSWRAWALRYLGNANAKQTPANQEIRRRRPSSGPSTPHSAAGDVSPTGGSPVRAARPAGRPMRRSYVTRVMAAYRDGVGTEVARCRPRRAESPAEAVPASALRRRRARTIAYPGDLEVRELRAATPGTRSRTRRRPAPPRPSAFTGSRSSGTARSARRAARPASPSTGRSSRPSTCTRSFTARKAVFTQVLVDRGHAHPRHQGRSARRGHPYVAIDELSSRRATRAASTSISTRKSAARAVTPTVALAGRLRREVLAIDRVERREIGEVTCSRPWP